MLYWKRCLRWGNLCWTWTTTEWWSSSGRLQGETKVTHMHAGAFGLVLGQVTHRYKMEPDSCGLWLVEAQCSFGLKPADLNTWPDAPGSRFHKKQNTANTNRLIQLMSTISQKMVCSCFLRSYWSPGPSSPCGRARQAVASSLPSGSGIPAEAAGHRPLLLLLLARAGRLLAAHPATLPPWLATGGAAVLPLPSHPPEKSSGNFTASVSMGCSSSPQPFVDVLINWVDVDAGYRGDMQGLLLQLRLMALGLLMMEQNVLWTIFPSAFLLQPNLVYCFPAGQNTTGVTTGRLLPG